MYCGQRLTLRGVPAEPCQDGAQRRVVVVCRVVQAGRPGWNIERTFLEWCALVLPRQQTRQGAEAFDLAVQDALRRRARRNVERSELDGSTSPS